MRLALKLLAGALLVAVLSRSCNANSEARGWSQLSEVKAAMYEDMKYTRACVKLLNNSGPQGCEGMTLHAPFDLLAVTGEALS